jgi:hypothetical protein
VPHASSSAGRAIRFIGARALVPDHLLILIALSVEEVADFQKKIVNFPEADGEAPKKACNKDMKPLGLGQAAPYSCGRLNVIRSGGHALLRLGIASTSVARRASDCVFRQIHQIC